MKTVIERSFGLNLVVLKLFFLYSDKEFTCLQKTCVYVAYLIFTAFIPVLGITFLILEKGSLDAVRMGSDGFTVVELTCLFLKIMPFLVYRIKIRNCINFFGSPVFADLNNKQQRIINNCSRICRLNSLLFLIFVSIGVVVWSSLPFFLEPYVFPVDVWLPIDPRDKSLVLWLVYAHIVIGCACASISTAVIDPLIGGLAYLAACQIRVLKDNLQHLDEYAEQEVGNLASKFVKSAIIFCRIQKCIKHHVAIINFVTDYEQCFSLAVFCQIAGSMFGICFCCFQLNMMIKSNHTIAQMTLNGFALVVLTLQIYFYCYFGTQLFEESNTINDAVYMGQWYNYDMKSKKALILIMERSMRPLAVYAGKILELSLVTFSSTLKHSYSLVAILNSQYQQ